MAVTGLGGLHMVTERGKLTCIGWCDFDSPSTRRAAVTQLMFEGRRNLDMKRLSSLLLAVCFCLPTVGCGSGDSEPADDAGAAASEGDSATTEGADEATTDEAAPE
jgi:hypothetical protein